MQSVAVIGCGFRDPARGNCDSVAELVCLTDESVSMRAGCVWNRTPTA